MTYILALAMLLGSIRHLDFGSKKHPFSYGPNPPRARMILK
jgi:hypothetical protein